MGVPWRREEAAGREGWEIIVGVEHRTDSTAKAQNNRSEETRRKLDAILHELRHMVKQAPAARTRGPDPGDVAQEVEEETTWLAVRERERDIHAQAELAMRRLAEGGYGVCATCGSRYRPRASGPYLLQCGA